MSDIGHNRISGQDLLERNLRSGMYRLGYDVLKVASIDRRLSRTHIQVLGLIVMTMEHTGYATPDRATMAAWAGVKVSRITNITVDLVNYGYISRVYIEDHTARVYTYGECIDHDQIIGQIMQFCEAMRPKSPLQEVEKSPLYGMESPLNIQESPLSSAESPLSSAESPLSISEKPLPRVDSLKTDFEKTEPLSLEENKERKKEEADASEPHGSDVDLLGDAVTVNRNSTTVSYRLAGNRKNERPITLQFLRGCEVAGIVSDDELLDYTVHVIQMFYAGAFPEFLKDGKTKRTVHGHLRGSFDQYEGGSAFDRWKRKRRNSTNPDHEENSVRRLVRELPRDDE